MKMGYAAKIRSLLTDMPIHIGLESKRFAITTKPKVCQVGYPIVPRMVAQRYVLRWQTVG